MSLRYIGAIDQGTSSSRFILFDKNGVVIDTASRPVHGISPAPGYLEHDPMEILKGVLECIEEVVERQGPDCVESVGITNQRETTVVWSKTTGLPLMNAIVWSDGRCDMTTLIEKNGLDCFRDISGLPLSGYFSAPKLQWMMQNNELVASSMEEEDCLFGNINSWLLYKLCGVFVTDVTNASRTLLMNIHTNQWDANLCKEFGVPMHILPPIVSCSECLGYFLPHTPLSGVMISGSIGDQQAACLGQLCVSPGSSKATYGTGGFILVNTGTTMCASSSGLLSTVCFQLGRDEPLYYALEGSIASVGTSLHWLIGMGIAESVTNINELASSVSSTEGVYFVNAFTGLLSPYWREDARASITGMHLGTSKAHVCRSVFEAIGYRTKEILEAIEHDYGQNITVVKVDGGVSCSDVLVEILARRLGVEVNRPECLETTAFGAAIAAGLFSGYWKSLEEIQQRMSESIQRFTSHDNVPDHEYKRWKEAVSKV